MLRARRSFGGMVTAPHHLASCTGLRILEEGGNAIEAMVAMAAAIAVAYPHMNGLGGDNCWLIDVPGQEPLGIDACGTAAERATIEFYRDQGFDRIPPRGPLAALTVAGAVSGWERALTISAHLGGRLPLSRIFEEAIVLAREGIAVTDTLHETAAAKLPELEALPGFSESFFVGAQPPRPGQRLRFPRLAASLDHLGRRGLDDFYRGDMARSLAADLDAVGSPVALSDLQRHRARMVVPLCSEIGRHRAYNLPPPTQGLASLIILGIYDRLRVSEADGFEFIHGLVEATKCAFRVRDRHITDPAYMNVSADSFLKPGALDHFAQGIDRHRAAPWPDALSGGDTVWMGAVDGQGRSVSFIQSLYWEFGSGVVLPQSGIAWQNRGTSFSLDPAHHNCLSPGRRPFHTIQPALAHLADGRVMVYGTMGGEGQPQTQAAVFTRHVCHGQDLQVAVTAPRWLLGRTWGAEAVNLKLESRFDPALIETLRQAGHDVEVVGPFEEIMGHAGALVRHPDGLIEGASDPRSDGAAIGF